MSRIDDQMNEFIDNNFTKFPNIENSLHLLKKLHKILKKSSLKNNLQNKLNHILHLYAAELDNTQKKFNQYSKVVPPIIRNMPSIAGKIIWARHLFNRIAKPINSFPRNFANKNEFKVNMKNYNKIGLKLSMYEQWYFRIWCTEIDKVKNGLASSLLVRSPYTKELKVNFDTAIL